MPQIRIVAVTENKEKWVQLATELYREKLEHFAKIEILAIKPYKEARAAVQEKIKKETEAILKKIDSKDYLVLCDEKGIERSSLKFAKHLEKLIDTMGTKRITFVIGGAYGVDLEHFPRQVEKIKLSSMTLNHYVAHTVLLEQVYRAFTILKGLPYHNEGQI